MQHLRATHTHDGIIVCRFMGSPLWSLLKKYYESQSLNKARNLFHKEIVPLNLDIIRKIEVFGKYITHEYP